MLKNLSAVLVVAIAGCVAYALLPVDVVVNGRSGIVRKIKAFKQEKSIPQVSVKNYSEIYARPLREPLILTAIKVKKLVISATPNKILKIKLLGTMVESGHTYGLFEGSNGKAKLVRAGQQFNNAKIISIKESFATLDYNKKTIVVKIIKPPPGMNAKSANIKSANKKSDRSSSRSRKRWVSRKVGGR